MKKIFSHVFSFVKHLFLRLRVVITLCVGRGRENKTEHEQDNEDPGKGDVR